MRKPIIVGNWKMNNGLKKSNDFYDELSNLLNKTKVNIDYAIAPPTLSLVALIPENEDGLFIPLAVQNVHYEKNGAFTGEISVDMLEEWAIDYAIIGHSERRQYFNETNKIVNKKVKAILRKSDNITPILAFGETEEEYNQNKTMDVIQKQLSECLNGLSNFEAQDVVLAYEPIWAIGTGKTATPEEAQKVIKNVREMIGKMFNNKVANEIRIQYGGSVNPDNIKELMLQPDIDGALVGGASLDAKSFLKLITYNK